MRKKTTLSMLKANGQETYLEKQMFTQLKYQQQNEDILEK